MEIVFVGTGGIFDLEFGNSSAIVTRRSRTFLIDCGPTVYPRLYSAGMADPIDYILVTHLHEDHVGSLSTLILHTNLRAREKRRATLLYPTEEFREDLTTLLRYCLGDPSEYVDFVPIEEAHGVGYVETTGLHSPDCRSFAYYFVDGSELIYFSGDVGDPGVAARFLESRREEDIRVFHELYYERKASHSHYSDVHEALGHYQVYGYHVDPRRVPADNRVPLVAHSPELVL
ncbi:MAG TPA: MBL fold metallo-hydrolase [Longimicrobiaceae bacterium]|nr:MBL fold metallo-hydrolase [Longimicrobiaceae bacterium]